MKACGKVGSAGFQSDTRLPNNRANKTTRVLLVAGTITWHKPFVFRKEMLLFYSPSWKELLSLLPRNAPLLLHHQHHHTHTVRQLGTTLNGCSIHEPRYAKRKKVWHYVLSSRFIKNDSYSVQKCALIKVRKHTLSTKYHYALMWSDLRCFIHSCQIPAPAIKVMRICSPMCITSHLPPHVDILILVLGFTLSGFTFSAFD